VEITDITEDGTVFGKLKILLGEIELDLPQIREANKKDKSERQIRKTNQRVSIQ